MKNIPCKISRKRTSPGYYKIAGLLFMMIFPCVNMSGQISGLVYPGQQDKLIYEKYANHGEDTLVNIVPDFSFAGYMGGGVALPENIPVQVTLEPTGSDDDKEMIQNAINQVSSLSPDENGFRGAVLLKKGLYRVNGPLDIITAGVILKGEGQLPAANGGTELLATAPYQHSLINMKGVIDQNTDNKLDTGEELTSFIIKPINAPPLQRVNFTSLINPGVTIHSLSLSVFWTSLG